MSSSTFCLVKFMLLLVTICIVISKCNAIHVEIVNELESGSSLTLHCKSKDDDLGEHVLALHQKYSFDFGAGLFKETLFFCGITFDGISHSFDAYDHKKDKFFDRFWHIKKDGPCLQIVLPKFYLPNDDSDEEVCRKWKT